MNERIDEDTLQIGLRAINDEAFTAIVAALDPDARAELSRICQIRTVRENEILTSDAEASDHVGYVLEGVLGMRKILPDGRTHIIGLLVPTDVYGRIFHNVSTYQLEALTAAKLLCFSRLPLEKLLLERHEIERHFLTNALDELDAMREWILLLGARKIVSRVASLLLILGRRSLRQNAMLAGNIDRVRVNIPIRRINLAEYLGTTVESLSRALRALERDGMIALIDPYNFEIVDVKALIGLIGDALTTP